MLFRAFSVFWRIANHIKNAWEWYVILTLLGIPPMAMLISGIFEGQPWSVLFLYVTAASAFVLVLLTGCWPLLTTAAQKLRQKERTLKAMADVYERGVALAAEIRASDESKTIDQCRDEYREWRQGLWNAMPSRGKAQYVDGVTSVMAADIGIKDQDKTTLILHIRARLERLSAVMREY